VDIASLDAAMGKATERADVLLVEGAGGLLVPITEELSFDGLFARWSLDVVIVAANRLGVINHTRLTVAATRAAGLTIRAVVLNDVGDARHPSMEDNASVIAELTHVPVAELPWLPLADDLAGAADAIDRSGLIELIGG
jgi:dethiobiotin synthetase